MVVTNGGFPLSSLATPSSFTLLRVAYFLVDFQIKRQKFTIIRHHPYCLHFWAIFTISSHYVTLSESPHHESHVPLPHRPIRLLALDGGGIRALLTCKVLEFIELRTGKRIHELFSLIAGTSTGGLLACGLTKPEPKTAAQMRDLYLKRGPEIFNRTWTESIRKVGGLMGPKFGDQGIMRVLNEEFGDLRLKQCLTPTMLTAYETQIRKPVFFTSWANGENYMRDVCRASSAGPTYFAPAHFGEPPAPLNTYVDGGLICNNPSVVALTEAAKLFDVNRDNVLVLSLGTGSDEQPIDYEQCRTWGQLAWVRPLISIMMDGVSALNAHILSEILPPQNHIRIQAILAGKMSEMDNVTPSNMAKLEGVGQKLVDMNRARLVALCDRLI